MGDMIITIAGVTGHLGGLIAKHVLNRSSTAVVHGICRSPSKLPKELASNNRLKVFQTSLDDKAKVKDALKGSNIAIFAALADNDTMIDGQKSLIDLSAEEGVPRFMSGDWSMDYRKLAYGEHPAKDPMKRITEYLEQKERDTNGKLKGVHVLNACFMEVPWIGIYNQQNRGLQYWGTGDEKWEFTTYNDAAQYTAAVALDQNATGWFTVRGDAVSAHDIARDFETAFDYKPENKRLGSLDDLYNTMQMVRKQQPQNVWAWLGMYYMYYSINGQTALPQPLSNERYPDIKPASLVDYLNAIGSPEKLGTAYDEVA